MSFWKNRAGSLAVSHQNVLSAVVASPKFRAKEFHGKTNQRPNTMAGENEKLGRSTHSFWDGRRGRAKEGQKYLPEWYATSLPSQRASPSRPVLVHFSTSGFYIIILDPSNPVQKKKKNLVGQDFVCIVSRLVSVPFGRKSLFQLTLLTRWWKVGIFFFFLFNFD